MRDQSQWLLWSCWACSQLLSTIHHIIFGELASTQPHQDLFICFACVCLRPIPKVNDMGFGASINTVSEEAHGLSDPPVNLHEGCRGHSRGQRSAFMHITNNVLLWPKAKAMSTGSSHEAARTMKKKFLSFKSNRFDQQKVVYSIGWKENMLNGHLRCI